MPCHLGEVVRCHMAKEHREDMACPCPPSEFAVQTPPWCSGRVPVVLVIAATSRLNSWWAAQWKHAMTHFTMYHGHVTDSKL